MLAEFYDFNYHLLTQCNIAARRHFNKCEESIVTEEDGEKRIHTKAYMTFRDSLSLRNINIIEKPILGFAIAFSIFDIYIDQKYTYLQGVSYKRKHDTLPITDNLEKMQKAFYRISKLIRNAITHDVSAINYANKKTIINYSFNSTSFYLEINDSSLIELYTAMLFLVDTKFEIQRGLYMKEGILKWYYDDIISNTSINDDCAYEPLSPIITLSPNREVIVNAHFSENADKLIIENDKYPMPVFRDYAITFNDECYVIPQEHLIDSQIAINDLIKWKSDPYFLTTHY
jgi:hypothetical protein